MPAAACLPTRMAPGFLLMVLKSMIRRRAAAAGVDPPGLHDFRRCFAIEMARNGVDTVTISRLLGHSGLNVTLRYLSQNEEDFRAAHKKGSPVDNADL